MGCSTPDFPVHHQLLELVQIHVHESVMPSNHIILCRPLLLPPSIFPNIRVFSNESVLHIRWPKYWGFSFSISPSNEYSGLISFRMDIIESTFQSKRKHLLPQEIWTKMLCVRKTALRPCFHMQEQNCHTLYHGFDFEFSWISSFAQVNETCFKYKVHIQHD